MAQSESIRRIVEQWHIFCCVASVLPMLDLKWKNEVEVLMLIFHLKVFKSTSGEPQEIVVAFSPTILGDRKWLDKLT